MRRLAFGCFVLLLAACSGVQQVAEPIPSDTNAWTLPDLGTDEIVAEFPYGRVVLTPSLGGGVEAARGSWDPDVEDAGVRFWRAGLEVRSGPYLIALGVTRAGANKADEKCAANWDLLDLGAKLVPPGYARPDHIEVSLHDYFPFFGGGPTVSVLIRGRNRSLPRTTEWVRPDIGEKHIEFESPIGAVTVAPGLNDGLAGVWCRWRVSEHGQGGAVHGTLAVLKIGRSVVSAGMADIGSAGGLSNQSQAWLMNDIGGALVPPENAHPRELEFSVFKQDEFGIHKLFTQTVPFAP
ncbi:MAG: hypothetical protein KDB90_06715 [Planctomycetes bacterium]|nr:hypothetical protein [Planctomycetota bacterium]